MGDNGPLLLLGGTFDPPHLGHLVLAECARAQFRSRQVRFLPAGYQYRKRSPHSPASVRLAMLELAVAGNPAFAIDRREIDRPGPTYTVDTLAELHAEGERDIVLLLGADALGDIPRWKEPARIAELARLAVAPRTGALPTASAELSFTLVDMPALDVSSTGIRERVAAGRPFRYLVPDGVEAFIRRESLYLPSAR